jgi:hypothetical protein
LFSAVLLSLALFGGYWGASPLKASLTIGLVLVLGIVVAYPGVFRGLMAAALRLVRLEPLTAKLSYAHSLCILAIFLLGWAAQGLGFFFLACSLYPVRVSQFPVLCGAYVTAWIVGFVAVFAPGGVGVREGSLAVLLQAVMPFTVAIALSFLGRLWIMLFEAAAALVGMCMPGTAGPSDGDST